MRMVLNAAVALALMPAIWVASAAWSTALTAGLLAHEVGRRIKASLA